MNGTDLRTVFDDLASHEAPPSLVDVSEAIRHGRRRAQMRRLATSTVALAVCAALVSVVVVMRPDARPNLPVVTPTDSGVSPTPSTSPSIGSAPVVALRTGDVVDFPDGHHVTLRTSSDQDEVGPAVVTPDGIVFTAYDPAGLGAVWWQTGAQTATKITNSNGNFEVSRDGRTLVVTDADSQSSAIAAFSLPSRTRLGTIQFSAPAMGPVVLNISGDWVLVGGANGSPAPSAALAWNLNTGYHKQLWPDASSWPIAITASGMVIARYDTMSGTKATRACYRVLAVTVIPAGGSSLGGHCMNSPTEAVPTAEDLSPDGKWLVFPSGTLQRPGMWIIAVADINDGAATGRRLAAESTRAPMWESDTVLVVAIDGNALDADSWLRCGMTGGCEAISIPRDSYPVQVAGG